MRFILSFLAAIIVQGAVGQSMHVPLLPKHLQRIEKAKSAKTKLKLYRRFFQKDSAVHVKKLQAALQRASDSTFLATKIAMSISEKKWLDKTNDVATQTKKLDRKTLVEQYRPAKAKEIKKEHARYAADLKKYQQQFGKFKNIDSLKSFTVASSKAMAEREVRERFAVLSERKEIDQYRKELEAVKQQQLQYANQMKQLGDSAYLKQQAKEKAEQLAMQYIENNPVALKAVQAKMNALMKIYSSVPNSNDLSTAVKRTSLQGRKFKERLVLGGNFQLVTIKPLALDLLPLAGYKFNTRFVVGLGGAYRFSPQDSIGGLVSKSMGFKGFSSFDVVGNFFVYTEFARNSIGKVVDENGSQWLWQNAWLVGAGKKISVHPKLDMTMVVLYNFFHKLGDPLYPKALTVRVGFQLSDIALLKR
jgi:hypothetical protein